MLPSPDLEIRTRSVPTAGYLLALGFEPLGIVTHPSGTKTFRFAPEAREALERFLLAKQRLDAMLEGWTSVTTRVEHTEQLNSYAPQERKENSQ